MRIKTVSIRWFRGAADAVELPANGKSMVIYGQNGAGKSSFVDGIEYAINDGKLQHLRHEYSGRRQERAIPNTHIPESEVASVGIKFSDNSQHDIDIQQDGNHAASGAEHVGIADWEYRRIVLRQDEVSDFIHARKGEKYSSLLPLFGLHDLDVCAENLRQLSSSIATTSQLEMKRGQLRTAEQERNATFDDKPDAEIVAEVVTLHAKYCSDSEETEPAQRCVEILAAINTQQRELTDQNNLYLALKEIAALNLPDYIARVRSKNAELAKSTEPLVAEKIAVLKSAERFAQGLVTKEAISCPACGSEVLADDFKDHVQSEYERLEEVTAVSLDRDAAIATIVDTVKLINRTLEKQHVADWRDKQKSGDLKEPIEWIEDLDPESYRRALTEEDLTTISGNCAPIIASSKADSAEAPPEIEDLNTDKKTAEAAQVVFGASELSEEVERVASLISLVDSMQVEVRDEIRDRSEEVIDEISDHLMEMWKCLHPGVAIDGVHLCMPDNDKAVEIGLTFHGKEQDSPQLTLSEGFRNSLGLCIFLAMAKREGKHDKPLVLDDVVISLDRDHRGMVAKLLEKYFADRQVLLMTHDRVWYAELRHVLDGARWDFRMLLPFRDPPTGIRWSHTTSSFDDARELVDDRPDSAANDARKIMDTETALIAERLQIRLPFLRGTRNDNRTCVDFVGRLASASKMCLQRKDGENYKVDEVGATTLKEAEALLVSWANRGSHTHDVVPIEAEQLLDKCEEALAVFHCDSCDKKVYANHSENRELYQCDCGELRWRYSKESSD